MDKTGATQISGLSLLSQQKEERRAACRHNLAQSEPKPDQAASQHFCIHTQTSTGIEPTGQQVVAQLSVQFVLQDEQKSELQKEESARYKQQFLRRRERR